ncbi:hypothetical protein H5410_031205 [Solanum commersonii]|uniref:Uncharacterized protein n=1 Tax=Solanum commersonii TaxID=4109 RepID=A0A9J5YGH1_SOLCO|nr:hypothetical protein H5410_031205 [Solanum commersonii]
MSRTRAFVSGGRGEELLEHVVKVSVRGDFIEDVRCVREPLPAYCDKYVEGCSDEGSGADPNSAVDSGYS